MLASKSGYYFVHEDRIRPAKQKRRRHRRETTLLKPRARFSWSSILPLQKNPPLFQSPLQTSRRVLRATYETFIGPTKHCLLLLFVTFYRRSSPPRSHVHFLILRGSSSPPPNPATHCIKLVILAQSESWKSYLRPPPCNLPSISSFPRASICTLQRLDSYATAARQLPLRPC